MPPEEPVTPPDPPPAVEATPPGGPAATAVPGRRRGVRVPLGRRGRTTAVAGVVAAALIAGLIAWSPWKPSAPSAGLTASTATTAQITWTASGGIAAPDHYLVLRDGQQVASVPASATSWTDHGLSPGTTYHYAVVAAGLVPSDPSAAVTVTTLAPSPVGLAVTRITYTTATLAWSPPRNAPAPDLYEIYNGRDLVDTIEGTVTSYTEAQQDPGSSFQFRVIAQWGNHKSAPSAPADGYELAAPLSGTVPVSVMTTAVPGMGASLSAGYHWDDYWDFTTTCPGDRCAITATVGIRWSLGNQPNYVIILRGSGGAYSGTLQAPNATHCKSTPTADTLTVTVKVKGENAVEPGAWQAWTGTMVLSAPSASSGTFYCPAQSWRFAVTSAS